MVVSLTELIYLIVQAKSDVPAGMRSMTEWSPKERVN
jgi:hypothetical protein